MFDRVRPLRVLDMVVRGGQARLRLANVGVAALAPSGVLVAHVSSAASCRAEVAILLVLPLVTQVAVPTELVPRLLEEIVLGEGAERLLRLPIDRRERLERRYGSGRRGAR